MDITTREKMQTQHTLQQLIDQYLGNLTGSIVDHVTTQYQEQGKLFEEATRDLELFKEAFYKADQEIQDREAMFEQERRAFIDEISQLKEQIHALNYAAASCIGKAAEVKDSVWDQEARQNQRSLEILCSSGIPVWKFLINCPLTMEDRLSLITAIFSRCKEIEIITGLSGDDAQSFVDVIDEMLDALAPQLRTRCLSTLSKICGCHGLLPKSVQIPLCYNRMDFPLYHGGYAEVWKGEYEGCKVAVKVLKVYQTSDLDRIKLRFCKEVMAWKTLRHQNLLPLLGVTISDSQFVMGSEWMVNGNINEFVKTRPDVNRFELLKDVAQGLIYMHSEGVAHGDIKGANILINQHARACIADFGLAAIISDPACSTTLTSSANAGTIRWMSPERLDPAQFGIKDSRPTKGSDCYALGMVILEVLSSEVPFAQDNNNFIVTNKVLKGEHPERPQGTWFTNDLWGTLQLCWSPQPNNRPTAEAVLRCLIRVSPPFMEDGSLIDTQ